MGLGSPLTAGEPVWKRKVREGEMIEQKRERERERGSERAREREGGSVFADNTCQAYCEFGKPFAPSRSRSLLLQGA